MNHSDDYRGCYTVWLFKGTKGEEITVVKVSEPDDYRYQHYYQTIIWQGLANGKADAMARASAK